MLKYIKYARSDIRLKGDLGNHWNVNKEWSLKVELKDGKSVTENEIISFCRDHLAGFKRPKKVVFGVLPKTATGKIQKYELRNNI